MADHQSYSFPILNKGEILECMAELKISMTEQELTKPNSEHIRVVYEKLTEMLVGVSREDSSQTEFGAADSLEFPELQESSIGEVTVMSAMVRLALTAGIPDFSLRDIMHPEYQRTRRILSAIINFAKYREMKLGIFNELSSQSEMLLQQKDQLEMRKQELSSQIKKIRQQRKSEEPEVDALKDETEKLTSQINVLNKEQALLKVNSAELKTASNELTDRLNSLKLSLKTGKADIEKLTSQIVRSPERMQSELVHLQEKLVEDKENLRMEEENLQEFSSKAQRIQNGQEELASLMTFMESVEAEAGKTALVKDELTALHSQLSVLKEELQVAEDENAHLKNKVTMTVEKMQRLTQQLENKRTESAASLNEVAAEKEQLGREQMAKMQQIRQIKEHIAQMENKMEVMKRNHEAELRGVHEKYEELVTEVQAYHKKLFRHMQGPRFLTT